MSNVFVDLHFKGTLKSLQITPTGGAPQPQHWLNLEEWNRLIRIAGPQKEDSQPRLFQVLSYFSKEYLRDKNGCVRSKSLPSYKFDSKKARPPIDWWNKRLEHILDRHTPSTRFSRVFPAIKDVARLQLQALQKCAWLGPWRSFTRCFCAKPPESLESFLQTPHILRKINNFSVKLSESLMIRLFQNHNVVKCSKMDQIDEYYNWYLKRTWSTRLKWKQKTHMKHCQMADAIFRIEKHVHPQILFESVRKKHEIPLSILELHWVADNLIALGNRKWGDEPILEIIIALGYRFQYLQERGYIPGCSASTWPTRKAS